MTTCECCRRSRAEYRVRFPLASFDVCGECAADTLAHDPDIARAEPLLPMWAL